MELTPTYKTIAALVLSAALPGVASAQEAVVAVDATPQKSVFKGSVWNKPVIIKSNKAILRTNLCQ